MASDAFARLRDGHPTGDQACRLPRLSLAHAMRLLPELWQWEHVSPLAIESIFTELMADVLPERRFAGGGKLQRVRDRLDADSTSLPTLEELASIAELHPVYLARAFRKQYGIAPSAYLRKLRLHRAVSLIARRRTLAGAASALGFVDQSHLHRCFVAEYGMTPGAFRRLALGLTEVSRIQDARLRCC